MRERGSRLASKNLTHKQPDERQARPPRPTGSGAARYEASADGRLTTRIHGSGGDQSACVTRIIDFQEAGLQVDAAPPSLRYVSCCNFLRTASSQLPSSNDSWTLLQRLEPSERGHQKCPI